MLEMGDPRLARQTGPRSPPARASRGLPASVSAATMLYSCVEIEEREGHVDQLGQVEQVESSRIFSEGFMSPVIDWRLRVRTRRDLSR